MYKRQILGNQLTDVGKNTERITEANKEIEQIETDRIISGQQSLDLRKRIMDATGGEMSLRQALAKAENENTNRQKSADVLRIENLIKEEKLFNEKQSDFDEQIDLLNTEIENRQDLIDLRIKENALIEQNKTNLKEEVSALNNVTDAVEKQGSWQRKLNAIKGEGKEQTLEGARTEYQSALSGAKAHLIAQIMKMRFPLNLLLAAGAESAVDNLFAKNNVKAFATGADYVTSGPEMIMVGDNPSGQERVQVTPLGGDPAPNAPQNGINLTFNNAIMTQDFVEGELLDSIKEGLRLGGDIGIN